MKNTITTILIDDEPLARKLLREYLQDFPDIKIIAECKNGRQAIKAINENRPDLIFLDIRMPGMDGFEVLENLQYMPHIIFSTAYGDYALKAFEMNAVDYLLKPYDRKRFSRAVFKVLKKNITSTTEIDQIVKVLQQTKERERYLERIFIRAGKKIVSVQVRDIVWIESDGDYTQLHTDKTSFICNQTLNILEKKLDPVKFMRVHRSSIIASNAIDHLVSDGEGGYIVTLKNLSKVKISRSYTSKVKHLIW